MKVKVAREPASIASLALPPLLKLPLFTNQFPDHWTAGFACSIRYCEVAVGAVVDVVPLDVPDPVGPVGVVVVVVVVPEPPEDGDVPELVEPVDPVEPPVDPVEPVGGVVVPAPLPEATSKASTHTHAFWDEALFCPVTAMVRVCGPLASPDTV